MNASVKVVEVATHLKLALSVDEAAGMVGLSAGSIRRLVDEDKLARVPHTQRVLIARVELERFVSQNLSGRRSLVSVEAVA